MTIQISFELSDSDLAQIGTALNNIQIVGERYSGNSKKYVNR